MMALCLSASRDSKKNDRQDLILRYLEERKALPFFILFCNDGPLHLLLESGHKQKIKANTKRENVLAF